MQCPANVCRICGEKEGVSLNEYIEAGRDAAQTARNKANKSKHAPQGPGWIATYLEKELSQCDKDTPVCSPCIEEHEIKYNRKWETTKASATPLCAAGFWSCTEKKGMQEVELGNERASLLTSHGIYCVGAHIQLCGTHLRAQQRAAKKMEQQTDAVTVTAGAASGTAGTADPHSNKRSNSGSTGQSPDRKRGSEGSGDGKHNTNSTDTGNKAPAPKPGSAIGDQLNKLKQLQRAETESSGVGNWLDKTRLPRLENQNKELQQMNSMLQQNVQKLKSQVPKAGLKQDELTWKGGGGFPLTATGRKDKSRAVTPALGFIHKLPTVDGNRQRGHEVIEIMRSKLAPPADIQAEKEAEKQQRIHKTAFERTRALIRRLRGPAAGYTLFARSRRERIFAADNRELLAAEEKEEEEEEKEEMDVTDAEPYFADGMQVGPVTEVALKARRARGEVEKEIGREWGKLVPGRRERWEAQARTEAAKHGHFHKGMSANDSEENRKAYRLLLTALAPTKAGRGDSTGMGAAMGEALGFKTNKGKQSLWQQCVQDRAELDRGARGYMPDDKCERSDKVEAAKLKAAHNHWVANCPASPHPSDMIRKSRASNDFRAKHVQHNTTRALHADFVQSHPWAQMSYGVYVGEKPWYVRRGHQQTCLCVYCENTRYAMKAGKDYKHVLGLVYGAKSRAPHIVMLWLGESTVKCPGVDVAARETLVCTNRFLSVSANTKPMPDYFKSDGDGKVIHYRNILELVHMDRKSDMLRALKCPGALKNINRLCLGHVPKHSCPICRDNKLLLRDHTLEAAVFGDGTYTTRNKEKNARAKRKVFRCCCAVPWSVFRAPCFLCLLTDQN